MDPTPAQCTRTLFSISYAIRPRESVCVIPPLFACRILSLAHQQSDPYGVFAKVIYGKVYRVFVLFRCTCPDHHDDHGVM
jgi:hypothetical protein